MHDGPSAIAAGILLWRGPAGAPEFLLLRNARHGGWGFAKGHLEPGEDLLAGALRECREETGVRLLETDLVPGFADASHYSLPHGLRKQVVMFLAGRGIKDSDLTRSGEHSEHQWLAPPEALEKLVFEELRRTVVRAAVRLARVAG